MTTISGKKKKAAATSAKTSISASSNNTSGQQQQQAAAAVNETPMAEIDRLRAVLAEIQSHEKSALFSHLAQAAPIPATAASDAPESKAGSHNPDLQVNTPIHQSISVYHTHIPVLLLTTMNDVEEVKRWLCGPSLSRPLIVPPPSLKRKLRYIFLPPRGEGRWG